MSTASEAPPWETIKWNSRVTHLEIDDTAFTEELQWEYKTPIELSAIKDKIALLNEDVWEYYKKLTNKYEPIFTTNGVVPTPLSICLLRPLSRSYFKMIEMIQVANLLGRFNVQTLRTAHVCEGPGGFIQAIYDEAARYKKRIIQTYAMTLKPNENQVPGWKRAMNFLKKHPEIKILYGKSNTGDILDAANRKSFSDECRGAIHLFTADGGVDFAANYEAQEKTIYPLLVASSLMALQCLSENGAYVLKIFDSFSRPTEDLILALGSCFQSWTLYKPATSRPCNSEQYFIGVGYRRQFSGPIITVLERVLAVPFLPNRLWKAVDSQLEEYRGLQKVRSASQVACIEATLALAEGDGGGGGRGNRKHSEIWNGHILESQRFCNVFHLPTVTPVPRATEENIGESMKAVAALVATPLGGGGSSV
jgi:23S rRNA U2552 (ribose-2'-O)-methylase RlmE/FtsJ